MSHDLFEEKRKRGRTGLEKKSERVKADRETSKFSVGSN